MSWLLLAGLAVAHDPAVTTFRIAETPVWHARISFPQAALDHALIGEGKDLAAMDEASYRAALHDHLVATVKLTANGADPIALGDWDVRLDRHQTDVVVELRGMPDALTALTADVRTFAANPNQHNILRLYTHGGTEHLVLSAYNDFRGELAAPQGPSSASASP